MNEKAPGPKKDLHIFALFFRFSYVLGLNFLFVRNARPPMGTLFPPRARGRLFSESIPTLNDAAAATNYGVPLLSVYNAPPTSHVVGLGQVIGCARAPLSHFAGATVRRMQCPLLPCYHSDRNKFICLHNK